LSVPRTKTPWRIELLEKEELFFEFFDTLKSTYNVGLVHHCKKAHKRRFCGNTKPRLKGMFLEGNPKAERGTTNKNRVKPLC
jgi:hypothetical protein